MKPVTIEANVTADNMQDAALILRDLANNILDNKDRKDWSTRYPEAVAYAELKTETIDE